MIHESVSDHDSASCRRELELDSSVPWTPDLLEAGQWRQH